MNSQGNLKLLNYAVTGDPDAADHKYHYSEDIDEVLHRLYVKIQKGKVRNPQEVQKYISRYPNIPAFKNYLVVFYSKKGKFEKAMKANDKLLEEHPDYLFAKINKCASYLQTDELDKIPEILGQALDLKDLYPEREVFHQSEFSSFLGISCRYLLATRNFEAVKTRLKMATDILGKDHQVIQQIDMLLDDELYDFSQEQYEEKAAKRDELRDKTPKYDYEQRQTSELPVFQHSEIQILYNTGVNIEREDLEKILQLPQESLKNDLTKVLEDAVHRYNFFRENWKEEEWDQSTTFPLHALAILTEIKTNDSIDILVDHLSNHPDILDFYYGDHKFETIWQFIYQLGQSDTQRLSVFQKDKNLSDLAKTTIQQAVTQIGKHDPNREEEVKNWYKDILNYFWENRNDPLECDVDVVSHAISEICDFNDESYLLIVKGFFDEGYVDVMLCGDYEGIKDDIMDEGYPSTGIPLSDNIFDLYQKIRKQWYGEETEEERLERLDKARKRIVELKKEKAEKEAELRALQQKLRSRNITTTSSSEKKVKIGRNEPCPCGSGKKYKKCCLN